MKSLFKIQKLLILFSIIVLTSCFGGITSEEKQKLLNKAKRGDVEAQYQVGTLTENYGSYYAFDEKCRLYYLQKAVEKGHIGAIQEKIKIAGRNKNKKEKIKWLKYGIEKGSSTAMYDLAEMYLKGDYVKKDTVRAKIYLQLAVEKGLSKSRQRLRKLNNETAEIYTIFLEEEIVDRWKTYSGAPLAKLTNIWWNATLNFLSAGFFLSADAPPFQLFGMPVWFTAILFILIVIAFIVLFFVGYFRYRKTEDKYYSWKIRFSFLPICCIIWGVYAVWFSDIKGVSFNLGNLLLTESGFWGALTICLTWIILVFFVYSVVIIIKTSLNYPVVTKRILKLLFFSIYGFFVGISGGLIIAFLAAFIIALWFVKGMKFSPFNLGKSGSNSSRYGSNSDKRVDCPYKTISGGCNLNEGWSCHIEKGSRGCPYGIQINT